MKSGDKAVELSDVTKVPVKTPPLAFVFSGQGAQWPQMGKRLMEHDQQFLSDIRAMDDVLSQAKIPPTWTIEGQFNCYFAIGHATDEA